MVFLLRFKNAEKALALTGKCIPRWVCGRGFYRREVDRSCYQKLSDLGLVDHTDFVLQHYGSELHGHVADNVSRSRSNHRSDGEMCQAGGSEGGKYEGARRPTGSTIES
ncbi:hypothetical protein EMIT047CA2_80051 [Pseudomonas soli]